MKSLRGSDYTYTSYIKYKDSNNQYRWYKKGLHEGLLAYIVFD